MNKLLNLQLKWTIKCWKLLSCKMMQRNMKVEICYSKKKLLNLPEVAKITKKWHSSRKKVQELNQTASLLWTNEGNQQLTIPAGQSWSSILQHLAPCQKKKQIAESVIHSVFHEVTWQRAQVKFLWTAQNDTTNQLMTRLLQQIFCLVVFSELSDEFAT